VTAPSKQTRLKQRLIACGLSLFTLLCGILAPNWASSTNLVDIDQLVADVNLQNCIQGIAAKKQWRTTQDVTEIVCHNKKILSLEGIERFTELTVLSLHKNNIRDVDIKALTKLKVINLGRNKLTTFQLSDASGLEELYLFNNKIRSLELMRLPALKKLKANSNKIESFSYQTLDKLEKIYLFDNAMEDIDIYSLPTMKYMDVRQNPMSDELYEDMDQLKGATILHDGNADDWN